MLVDARLKYYQTFPSIIRNILTDQNVSSMLVAKCKFNAC